MDSTYAAQYRTLYERHWWWRARERVILRTLEKNIPVDGRQPILDVGCGDGLLFDKLARFGDVEGIEADGTVVSPDGPWRQRIYVGPFDERFDPGRRYAAILMLDVLEHMSDPAGALRHALSLLTADGVLVITVPAFRSLWTTHDDLNHHYTRYTRRSFRRLADEAGLEIREMRYLFQWLSGAKLAVRLKESLWRSSPKPPALPPPMVNKLLYGLSRTEETLLRRLAPPFGSSLLAVGLARVSH